MTFKQIIWDWNGTILDDTDLNHESTCVVLEKHGLPPITLDYYRNNLRFPLTPFYEKLGLMNETRDFAEIAEDFYAHYCKKFIADISLHENVLDIIKRGADLNLEQTILSARSHDSLLEEVEHFTLSQYFSKVQGSIKGEEHKGKLDYANRVLSDHDPKEVVMIGDTIHDYEIADALGINSVLIAQGVNSRKLLEETPSQILDSHTELAEILFE